MRVATLRTNVMTQAQIPQLHVQPLADSNSLRVSFISISASVLSVILECVLVSVIDCICFPQHRTRPSLANANFLEHCKPLFIKLEVLTVINLFIYDVLLYTLNNMNNYNLVSTLTIII